MNDTEIRLQGTDGVRGVVAADDDPRIAGLSPSQAFLSLGLLTPAFVETYCRAFVEFLRRAELLPATPVIALGRDPRDRERIITDAAIRGLRAAGVTVHDVGILPTPALALYTVAAEAAGGVMLTASHNPADQNGVKLFLPYAGIKLFPREDRALSAIHREMEQGDAARRTPAGAVLDQAERAREIFSAFFADRFNSWVDDGDFSDIVLVIDAANGAVSPVATEIFEPFGFRYLELVSADIEGAINDRCGAGILEGHGVISADFVSDAGGDFRDVPLVQALFRHGRSQRDEIRRGAVRVAGAAFDGDGDRCYLLEYDPGADAVLILSGDEIAYHQARQVRSMLATEYNGFASFVTTVESDINVSVAAEELGFMPVTTGVGDKWLLWEACAAQLSGYWDVLEEESDDLDMLADLEDIRYEFERTAEPDAVNLITRLQGAEKVAMEEDIEILVHFLQPWKVVYAVGSEETGHSVTIGRVTTESGSVRVVYIGNGPKSAINALVASRALRREVSLTEFHKRLHRPFPRGLKRTLPVYYTDKGLLNPGSTFRAELEELLLSGARARFGNRFDIRLRVREEEPEMVYLAFADRQEGAEEGSVRAALFVRNSGTEAKTSIYLRGPEELGGEFADLVEEAALVLHRQMKESDSPWAMAERAILTRLRERGPLPLAEFADLLWPVNGKRLLVEMGAKQKLVEAQGDRLALTGFGRRIVQE